MVTSGTTLISFWAVLSKVIRLTVSKVYPLYGCADSYDGMGRSQLVVVVLFRPVVGEMRVCGIVGCSGEEVCGEGETCVVVVLVPRTDC